MGWLNKSTLLACCAMLALTAAGDDATDALVPDFDWLVAAHGKQKFAEGFITLNTDDLERFLPTGNLIEAFVIGELSIENRAGTYYGNELDVPASMQISHADQVLVGGKGIAFDLVLLDDKLMVEHWDGTTGCSLSRWYLQFDLSPKVQVVESEYADVASGERCSRP